MEIPLDVDRTQALKNVHLYLHLMTILKLERSFVESIRPEITTYDAYLFQHTFPGLLTENTGSLTVADFLCESCDSELQEVLEEAQMILTPLVDLFFAYQIDEAYDRLNHLSDRLKGYPDSDEEEF